jgi:hypothetical protein
MMFSISYAELYARATVKEMVWLKTIHLMFGSFGMVLISIIDWGIIESFSENVLLFKLELSRV